MSIYNRQTTEFEFRPGPVFANIVIADEINRASPKTQSALLECMAEHQVTVDGATYALASPFMVVATQNPIEMDGTYPLPEAQRDRFTLAGQRRLPRCRVPSSRWSTSTPRPIPLDLLRPVTDARHVAVVIGAVRRVHVGPEVRQYCVDLVSATRRLPELRLGASPRATLQLVRAAKAQAALSGARLRRARRRPGRRGAGARAPVAADAGRRGRPPLGRRHRARPDLTPRRAVARPPGRLT